MTNPDNEEIGLDDRPSSLYYVVGRDEAGAIQVFAFKQIGHAEGHRRTLKGSFVLAHSQRALRKLPMDLLMGIVQIARPEFRASNLRREDLARVAHSSLWAAYLRTGNNSLTQEVSEVASTTIGRSAGQKVREMRTARKTTKASGASNGKSAKRPAAPRAKSEAGKGAVRANKAFEGKTFTLTGEANPRREGTHGWKSMEVVRKKPGINFEEYLKAGGRLVDLKGSLDKKEVEAK